MLDEIAKENENLLKEIKDELNIKKENKELDIYSLNLERIEKGTFDKLIEVAEGYLKIPYRVYSNYAFDIDYKKKSTMNYLYYISLQRKYKIIGINKLQTNINNIDMQEYKSYDLIYSYESIHTFTRANYDIYKVPKELARDEIALILDEGNLCFGYTSNGSSYTVYED